MSSVGTAAGSTGDTAVVVSGRCRPRPRVREDIRADNGGVEVGWRRDGGNGEQGRGWSKGQGKTGK